MILSRADLTTANLILFGEKLMEKSDDLSDWLWEDCGCNPDAVIPNPTLGISDAVAYHCDIPESARALIDVSGYLKSAEWLETLFRMSQDYDGFHGPHAANLD